MITQLDAPLAWTKEHLDLRVFLRGLIAVGGIYLLLFIVIFVQSGPTIQKLETRMMSQTVSITEAITMDMSVLAPPPHGETPINHETTNQHDTSSQALGHHALPAAPIEGIYEQTDNGLLPIKHKDNGLTPFDAYKRPFSASNKPIIAIIVEDFGLSSIVSNAAINNLPTDVTLLLSAYGRDIEAWQDKARTSGYETWVTLPVETEKLSNVMDTGPQTILVKDGIKQHNQKLEWALTRTSGYTGFATLTDKMILSSPVTFNKMINTIFNRGLAFLELNPEASPAIETMAISAHAPYLKADLYINDRSGAQSPFKRLESIAKEKGYALGVLSPSLSSIKQANIWLKNLEAKGFTLAPASAVAQRQMSGYVQTNATEQH